MIEFHRFDYLIFFVIPFESNLYQILLFKPNSIQVSANFEYHDF
jgi:hypothetical protein